MNVWGPPKTTPRYVVKGVYEKLRRLNQQSDPANPLKVFVGSMTDWAEDHPTAHALRPRMWSAIRENDHLIFQMLTKRAEAVKELLPQFWPEIRARVWLGVSVENADYAWRADHIRHLDAAVRFVSYEPALGPLAEALDLTGLDWIIYGGESGPRFRPEDKQWARDMRRKCKAAGVAFYHKQSTALRPEQGIELDGEIVREYPQAGRIPLALV
jgi:protein gp37